VPEGTPDFSQSLFGHFVGSKKKKRGHLQALRCVFQSADPGPAYILWFWWLLIWMDRQSPMPPTRQCPQRTRLIDDDTRLFTGWPFNLGEVKPD
jgi:hypothetical protein